MKKFFYMSVLVLMAALTLTSCGSDDSKDEPSGSKTIVYSASVSFSQDMIDICDVTLTYKDADGKTVAETIKSTTWSKTFNVKKLPAVVGAKCDFKLKDGVQLTKDKYDIVSSITHNVTVDGAKKGYDEPQIFIGSYGVKNDKVAEQLPRRTGKMFGYTISANGGVNATESIDF